MIVYLNEFIMFHTNLHSWFFSIIGGFRRLCSKVLFRLEMTTTHDLRKGSLETECELSRTIESSYIFLRRGYTIVLYLTNTTVGAVSHKQVTELTVWRTLSTSLKVTGSSLFQNSGSCPVHFRVIQLESNSEQIHVILSARYKECSLHRKWSCGWSLPSRVQVT